MVKLLKTGVWLGFLTLLTVPAHPVELRLAEDRMYLSAERELLGDILEEFVRIGVSVQVEPGIDAVVTGTLEDVAIGDGLDELLGAFNYLLFWRVIEGPVGRMTSLSAIHLFRPGKERDVVPFVPEDGGLEVVRLRGVPPHVRSELLLGVKPGTNAKQFRELLASIGGTVVDSIGSMGIYRVRLPRSAGVAERVAALQRNPWVSVAEPNYVFELPDAVPSDLATAAPQVVAPPKEGAPALAIFDSGLEWLEVLQDAVTGSYDAVQPGRKISDPVGHGTQMALVASGAVAPGGVPPELVDEGVPILAVRSFDDRGRATNYGLLRGIDYVVNEGGRVVSMSWGTETNSEFLKHAVMYAQDQGLIVVASAGNQPINRPLYPAAYRGVLAVSAITTDGEIWDQSNFGNFIFAAAPGTGSFPIGYNGPPGTYAGTSISSPFVARALTQYLTLHPVASNEQAVKALTDALTDAGELGRDDKYGHGSLDAEALKRYLQ